MERILSRTIRPASLAALLAAAVVGTALAAPLPDQLQAKDCSRDSMGLAPLNDLGSGTYEGVQGGLYGGGSNQCPFGHEFDGLRIARTIAPTDTSGAADPSNGRVVMVALGGNNANLQFAVFMSRLASEPAKNPQLLAVNAAAGGFDLLDAADPAGAYWDTVATRLRGVGSSPAQVQVAWMKFYVESVLGDFATSTDSTAELLTRAIRNARSRLPNLRLLYLTPRIYAGYDNNSALTEPNAYWTGFGVRQVILSQVTGDSLVFDPARGTVVAPWTDWGPYLWADGMEPRSDGLIWACSDYTGNGYVPSQAGRSRFADSLLAFFKTEPTATPWFLAPTTLDAPGVSGGGRGPGFVVAPNPAGSLTRIRVTAVEGAWTLRVVDLQGRLRRGFAGAGPAEIGWDLRDDSGLRLPAGVYWARLSGAAGGATRTIIVR